MAKKSDEPWVYSLRCTKARRDTIQSELAKLDSRSINWWIVKAIDEKLTRDRKAGT